ncbi:diacylglycerol kinase family lipid kinase [soil metagenome]
MHVTLIHKSDAGEGEYSRKKLKSLFTDEGHKVNVLSSEDDWVRELPDPTDLVVIAGGDGTVASVALELVGTGIPFSVLPLGTANNIATELNGSHTTEDVIAALAGGKRIPIDVGVAAGPWGSWRFIEGVGLGPFTRAVSFVKRTKDSILPEPSKRKKTLRRDLRVLDAFLMEGTPERCEVEIDGVKLDGPHLLVEVLNIGMIGPNVRLAPDANPGDSQFDVVLVGETERERLHDYLEQSLEDETPPPVLPVHRGKHVRLTMEACRLHVDDTLWPSSEEAPPALGAPMVVDIRLEEAALMALVPE